MLFVATFNIGNNTDLLLITFQYGPNQYGLVVYGTIGHTPEPAVQYVKETRDAKEILQYLKEVK